MKLSNVSVRLSYPEGSDTGKRVEIRIEDETSSQAIVEVELGADQLIMLMSGRLAYGTGEVAEHPDRFGRKLVTQRFALDAERLGLGYAARAEHPGVQSRMEELYADGWADLSYQCQRGEHSIFARRWVEYDGLDHD